MVLNESLYSSDKEDWETPPCLFAKLNNEFSFTLDPCASASNAKCERYFTKDDDGLSQRWDGVVFMNPPYGRGIKEWVRKAKDEALLGSTVVCLVPVRSDSRWWHHLCMKSSEIRLLTRRLTFSAYGNKAPFPAAIVIFRPEEDTPRLSAYVV